MCRSEFEEDSAVMQTAEALGLSVDRWVSVKITDHKAIEAAGLTVKRPDFNRIRKLLLDGMDVAGAELGPVEYRLTRRKAADVDAILSQRRE